MIILLLAALACTAPAGGRVDKGVDTDVDSGVDTDVDSGVDSGDAGRRLRVGACDALDVDTLDLASLAAAEAELDTVAALGLRLARPHRPGGHAFALNLVLPEGAEAPDFTLPDAVVAATGRRGLPVFGTFMPETNAEPGGPPARDHLLPEEEERWDRFVAALVERYDGDGLDDMPGLAVPAAGWEVVNEPPCEDDACSEAFAALVERSRAVARTADAAVPVLPGAPLPLLLGPDVFNPGPVKIIEAVDAAAGGAGPINLHMLVGAAAPELDAHLDALTAIVGGPRTVWVTEMGTHSPSGAVVVSTDPDVEAAWLVDQWQQAEDAGVHTVLWCAARSPYDATPEVAAAARAWLGGD